MGEQNKMKKLTCKWCKKGEVEVEDLEEINCDECSFTSEECSTARVRVTFCPKCEFDVAVCVKNPQGADNGSN
jgi:hypothetical protein